MSEPVDRGWQPVRRVRTHEHVLDQIRQQILDGRLSPGDRLPGERELAEYLDVSRAGVREALRVLESMGVVRSGVGSGPSAGSVVTGGGSEALANLLSLHVALSRFSRREVMDVRIQLERWAMSEASAHASADDIAGLRSIVLRMRQREIDYDTFLDLDTQFHVTIAQVCGNTLVGDLMAALREAVRREMLTSFEQLTDWRATADQLCDEHQGIVDRIEDGDSRGAAAAVEQHIANFYELTSASAG
jgi:GntR family transcriptional regulator, transcriptional repressor for pyruvate dehydrogenase complex